jgi:hypothetical protein
LGEIGLAPFEALIWQFLGGTEENREKLSIAGYQVEIQNASASLFNAFALLNDVMDFSYPEYKR